MGMCGKKRARGIQAKTTRAIWEEGSFVYVCVCVCVRERVHWGSGGKVHIRGSQCVCVHTVSF